ncbi:hypothetical protein GC093_12765 [Paenibacillus sp. LMG 31456]|uniref:Uncharacterized protein n=1 Tax=Paenibacillus foliorum TaxID=2654974 RepID=A0A972GTW1_9BACL|nr:hypothetical protein [Paenibacillus foliorum]NOU94083.1 hypothetical protein [Paenibacillus foliorum]
MVWTGAGAHGFAKKDGINGYFQTKLISDSTPEAEMAGKMIQAMKETQAPEEQYVRHGFI